MQLIREGDGTPQVDMLDTMKNVRMGLEAVNEKFGVTPDTVGDVLALMGDSGDNVPGVRGVGPKTATTLIQDYGNLTAATDDTAKMKAYKRRDSQHENTHMAEV